MAASLSPNPGPDGRMLGERLGGGKVSQDVLMMSVVMMMVMGAGGSDRQGAEEAPVLGAGAPPPSFINCSHELWPQRRPPELRRKGFLVQPQVS